MSWIVCVLVSYPLGAMGCSVVSHFPVPCLSPYATSCGPRREKTCLRLFANNTGDRFCCDEAHVINDISSEVAWFG